MSESVPESVGHWSMDGLRGQGREAGGLGELEWVGPWTSFGDLCDGCIYVL